MPAKLRRELSEDPEYDLCSLIDLGGCGGGVTWEHSIIYGGRQVQERWAIIPLCEKHHGVNGYQDVTSIDKNRSVWVAVNRATDEELCKVSKVVNYIHERKRLNDMFGGPWTCPI